MDSRTPIASKPGARNTSHFSWRTTMAPISMTAYALRMSSRSFTRSSTHQRRRHDKEDRCNQPQRTMTLLTMHEFLRLHQSTQERQSIRHPKCHMIKTHQTEDRKTIKSSIHARNLLRTDVIRRSKSNKRCETRHLHETTDCLFSLSIQSNCSANSSSSVYNPR